MSITFVTVFVYLSYC